MGRDEPGQLVNKADGVQVLEALPHAGDGTAVAHRDSQIIRHLPVQLLSDLQSHGLLTLREVGIDGSVAVVPAVFLNGLGGHLEGLLVVALDGDNIGAEDHQLGHLSLGRALGNKNIGLKARSSGITRQGGGDIAGGGAGDGLGTGLIGLGHGHSAGPVL